MIKVNFYKPGAVDDEKIVFVVIMARYGGKWIVVRHRARRTWEIPGGHREYREKVEEAARRELYEETGAQEFNLTPVSIYSVNDGKTETFGQLFYAEVELMGRLPDMEIVETKLVDDFPEDLTYPFIQPFLFAKVAGFISGMAKE